MILIKILCTVLIIVSFNKLVECRSYNNGLIFYNLENHKLYLPPTISVSRGRGLSNIKYSSRGSIWSTFGKPCDCKGPLCGCCVGIKVKQYNFVEKMCANVSYFLPRDEIQLEVFLNDTATAKYGIAARNPSPLCVPIMMGIPMSMCIQMSNIGVQGDNLNMCMDFLVRLASTELFEMHFQCMKVGLQGASWVGTDGQPVIPANEGTLKDKTTHESDEYYDESQEGVQDNEINTSKEIGHENIATNIQEGEEEMDNNDITEKIMDIVKIKEQQQVVQESNAAIEKIDYSNAIPTLDHKQVGQIVTNIMESINEGNAAEKFDTLMETAVKKDSSYSVENATQMKDTFNDRETLNLLAGENIEKKTETLNLENAKTDKNYTSKNETSEKEVENLGESATTKYDDKIIENSADSEVLFNNTALKDELHLAEFLEYPQQQELNSSVNAIEKQQEEFYNINLEKETEDNILNDLEKLVTSTEYSVATTLRPTASQKTNATSEIGKTNTKNTVITTETIMFMTTTNKPLKADINPAVAIPAIENANDISSNKNLNKNKNSEKEVAEDEEQNKDNANCDDDDGGEDEDDDDEYDNDDDDDDDDVDDSHENDSDESAEADDDADDEPTENNDSISNYIPTSVKLNQIDSLTTQDHMSEPNSDETYDQLVFEEEEFKLNKEKETHYNKLNALLKNNDGKSYDLAGMHMKDLKHKVESNKQSSNTSSTSTSSLQNKNPPNNIIEIPQIVTAANNNLQFVGKSKNNFMFNSADGGGEREELNIKSNKNKMSQMSISNATSRYVMPLPLARNLLSLYHHHPHHLQQHSRHHNRQRLFYV